jgi:oxygen-dependent protoporphyrinogen oxidase
MKIPSFSPDKIPQVVVVGGGIAGIACAFHILELSRQKKFPLRLLLLESSQRLGGVISTLNRDGCRLELGPDAIFTEKPWGLDFLKKMGLENEIVGMNPEHQRSFIARDGRLLPVPEGFYLLAPSRISPLLVSPLFSVRGKLRALCDLFIPRRNDDGDESLESFVLRRLGKEVLERMAEPMVGGIYSSDPKDLSLEATFPVFLELERKYGSLIRGLAAKSRRVSDGKSVRGPRYSLFVTLESGLERLVDRAKEKIPAEAVRYGSEVSGIGSEKGRFKVKCGASEIEADAVCLACSAEGASRILSFLDREISSDLAKIPCHSGTTVNLVYSREDVPHPLDGFGFVVPGIEKGNISGCTFSSIKFNGRAPSGKVVLRAFLGGYSSQNIHQVSDHEAETKARIDLKKYLGIVKPPLFSVTRRHPSSLPQYRVGHLNLVRKIETRLRNFPGLKLSGNYFHGVGIPDCIRSAEIAAERLMEDLEKITSGLFFL